MPHNFGTLPAAQPKRERIFSMRLSDNERLAIEELAQKLNVPDSVLARHFVMEAVNYHHHNSTETPIEQSEA